MRKALVAFSVGLAAVVLAAAPVSAQEESITGSFTSTGEGFFGPQPGGECVPHIFQDGVAELSPLGTSSFHLDFCVAGGIGDLFHPISDGTFTLTSPMGTLTGSDRRGVGGFIQDPAPEGFGLHIVLTVASGTGQLEGVTGEIILDGFFSAGASTASGTVSGSLNGLGPPTPGTKDDCRNGGWRNFADDQGVPFPSQGRCVSFVVHASQPA
jgi:hypothetical protein